MEAIGSQPLALAFQKLNLAAIHERGKWSNNHFPCVLGLREGRRPSCGRI